MKHIFDQAIVNLMDAFRPREIREQEAHGQSIVVHNDVLPLLLDRYTTLEGCERLGFVFGERIDEILCHGTVPPGWSKKPSPTSVLHTHLIDAKGRRRGAILYKAAIYDRNATLSLLPRYAIRSKSSADDKTDHVTVQDGDAVVKDFGVRPWREGTQLREDARTYLNENFPDWRNPFAYWED